MYNLSTSRRSHNSWLTMLFTWTAIYFRPLHRRFPLATTFVLRAEKPHWNLQIKVVKSQLKLASQPCFLCCKPADLSQISPAIASRQFFNPADEGPHNSAWSLVYRYSQNASSTFSRVTAFWRYSTRRFRTMSSFPNSNVRRSCIFQVGYCYFVARHFLVLCNYKFSAPCPR